jgi:hypothetical protein
MQRIRPEVLSVHATGSSAASAQVQHRVVTSLPSKCWQRNRRESGTAAWHDGTISNFARGVVPLALPAARCLTVSGVLLSERLDRSNSKAPWRRLPVRGESVKDLAGPAEARPQNVGVSSKARARPGGRVRTGGSALRRRTRRRNRLRHRWGRRFRLPRSSELCGGGHLAGWLPVYAGVCVVAGLCPG